MTLTKTSTDAVRDVLNEIETRCLKDAERIRELEEAARATADQLRTMSVGIEGRIRNRICTAANRLDKALGRQQSSHGDKF